jgi:uncharacterized lipoprotein YddW (UPF0748 family)
LPDQVQATGQEAPERAEREPPPEPGARPAPEAEGPGAERAPDGEAPAEPASRPARREVRAIWVTRWDYASAADVHAILERVRAGGFNTVLFQVRGAADAYYRSSLEPWAAPLAGKLGQDPGWDPLAVAVAEARRLGLELHAWLNLCTGWKGAVRPGPSTPRHVLRHHLDWRVVDRGGRPMPFTDADYTFLNPAHPEVQRHLEAVVAELASFYELDGVHLDYARYPAHGTSYDRTTNRLFAEAKRADRTLSRAAWQREELTRLVARLKERVHEVRPGIVVSAAVTGIWQDLWGWGGVTQGFHDFHQDSHLWAERGAVDALVPMIYWRPTRPSGKRTDFRTLVEHFAPLRARVGLWAGINVEAGDFEVLLEEIAIAREHGLQGVALFAWKSLAARGYPGRLAETAFAPAPPQAESRAGE